MAALEFDAQMVSHWKSKGPNLNFIIQPDTADQQNVLTQKYGNNRWRMTSGWEVDWERESVYTGAEEVEKGGCTFPISLEYTCSYVVFKFT